MSELRTEMKDGFYFIKDIDHPDPVYWEVAELVEGKWYSGDEPMEWYPKNVGPRIPTPDEAWQCVPIGITPDMRKAGQHAQHHGCFIDGIYADILAAAPKPEDA